MIRLFGRLGVTPIKKPSDFSSIEWAVAAGGILSGVVALVSLLQLGTPALPEVPTSRHPVQPSSQNRTVPAALEIENGPAAADKPAGSDSRAGCPGPPEKLYIFPDSNSRVLQPEELQSLPTYKLRIARNEIFARHGMRFNSDMKTYFSCEPWYHATSDNVSGELSSVEHANIASILRAEHGR